MFGVCLTTGSISMISGKRFSYWWLSIALSTLAGEPAALSPQEVLDFSGESWSLRYQEEKHLRILEQPLTSSGLLHFEPPDTLVREIDGWRGTVYRIEGNQVSISEGGRILRQIDLQAIPELAGFASILRALLAADIETLEKQYTLTLTGTVESWTLHLSPRNEPLSQLVERVSIEGGNGRLQMVEILESGGNRSRMLLNPDE